MQIGSGTVFSFHYAIRNEAGEELENSRSDAPQLVMYGRRQVLPALEEALAGKQAGDQLTLALAPEKAYGLRKPDATARVPIKHLANKPKKLKPGMMVQVNTQQGLRNATVLKVGKFNVDLDTNHPFAGLSVTFDVEVIEVREVTRDEQAHGHAHGPGGHHH